MTLYLSHSGVGSMEPTAEPDWWIVEPRDNPEQQVRSLVAVGRRVIAVYIDALSSTTYEIGPANVNVEFS